MVEVLKVNPQLKVKVFVEDIELHNWGQGTRSLASSTEGCCLSSQKAMERRTIEVISDGSEKREFLVMC